MATHPRVSELVADVFRRFVALVLLLGLRARPCCLFCVQDPVQIVETLKAVTPVGVPGVELVKDLAEDEGVEDDGQVTHRALLHGGHRLAARRMRPEGHDLEHAVHPVGRMGGGGEG